MLSRKPVCKADRLHKVSSVTVSPQAKTGPGQVCPHFHAAIELIGRRWSGAILCALIGSELRFADISRAVPGVSDRLLSARLREFEAEGLVERLVEAGAPVRVSYRLTDKGAGLEPVIQELGRWADHWNGNG